MSGLRALESVDAIVLIDGPSGAGKSTLARLLVEHWPGPVAPVLVRMDDIYPGWGGLDAASAHVHEFLVTPRAAHRPGRWRRHDWAAGRAAEWHTVPAERPLIIEGCGSLSRATAPLADLRIWMDAPADVRKTRALARDSGAFDAHWDMWTEQVDAFVTRELPETLADVVLQNAEGEALSWLTEVVRQRD